MENVSANPIIFYLSLEDSLPKTFFIFDRVMKRLGFILVPIKVDQLQVLANSTDQSHLIVFCSVTDAKEYKLYNEKVRGLLKYILKSKRISFMHLASFTKLNDSNKFAMSRNYFFLKYPLDAAVFGSLIARYYRHKMEQNIRWPGGRRASMPGSVV